MNIIDNMSKIILSFSALSQGGAGRVCANLSYALCDNYESVILIAWNNHTLFYEFDLRARLLSVEKEVGSKNDLKRLWWFRNFVKHEKPDLILSFMEPYNLRVLFSTIGLGVPTVVSERNEPHAINKYWLIDQFEKLVYELADGIVVQTPTIQRFFDGRLASRTRVLYNPVDLPLDMVGNALNTPKKNRVVSLARLIPQKKHDVLIRAFAKFCKNHSGYTLTIYGEGPSRDSLLQLAVSLGIGDKVSLPGNIKCVHEAILDANMMCLVSSREGMSNAMIEAMCLGLPCICTKVSGAVDLINDGKNGMLVDVDDMDALAEKMRLLADDASLSYSIGHEALGLFDVLNKTKINEEWISYLNQFIK